MPWNAIGGITGSIISGIVSAANTAQVNANNLQISRETNQANRELVELQNKAAKEEAELAYKRSSAPNQVALMQSAGMSRAGAINVLNGGGSYTPAPVNTSQDSAPQMQTADLSALGNISQILAQRAQHKHEEKMQSKQLDLERDKLQLEKDKLQETANQNAALRNLWQQESDYNKARQRQIDIRNEIDSVLKDGVISAGKKDNLAKIAEAQLREIKANASKVGYDSLSPAQIKIISEYQASLEVMANFGSMSAQKIIEYLHDIIDSLPFM